MKNLTLLLVISSILAGCIAYNKIWVGPSTAFEDENFKENISEKEVFMHNASGERYRARSVEIDDSVISATYSRVEDTSEVMEVLSRTELQKRHEVHFYLLDSIDFESARPAIHKEQIKEIAVYRNPHSDKQTKQTAEQNETAVRSFFIALTIIISVVVAGLLLLINSTINSCYIATMVYESYDAPEVMTLRSFRDQVLKKYFFGRLFVGFYYLTSPSVVRLTKNSPSVNRFFRKRLDRFVDRIRSRGIK
jgi:hypothetical protein